MGQALARGGDGACCGFRGISRSFPSFGGTAQGPGQEGDHTPVKGTPPKHELVRKQQSAHRRTSHRAMFRLRCSERNSMGHDKNYPVRLVVFDLDETLTLVTFMTPSGCYKANERQWARLANFESPWVEGSRIKKLQAMLRSLRRDASGRPRTLAILTKNQHQGGAMSVLNLLRVAELADEFSAIWTMPWRSGIPNGAYQEAGTWRWFDPPVNRVRGHKADLLQHVAGSPAAWFPQLSRGGGGDLLGDMRGLKPEGIVLVDDQRANFQSDSGASVIRYCKVARYDATFLNFGLLKDMGGIGAHDDADYETLTRFVEDPWMCKETLQVRCNERDFEGNELRRPVRLVVFDFDETLTLATFMPKSEACATLPGWTPGGPDGEDWTQEDLVTYNFESPYVPGSRVAKLGKLLDAVAAGSGSGPRVLAVLTQNASGSVAVLNLLRMAGLADHFSAIWTVPGREGCPRGAYQEAGRWRVFQPPADAAREHKADVLHHVAESPASWFPQLAGGRGGRLRRLLGMPLEAIVLVDDERANFRSSSASQAKVLRYCKVARYDEVYRDCGLLNQMGGVGAHSDADYEALRGFLEQPWEHPYEGRPAAGEAPAAGGGRMPELRRSVAGEEAGLKTPRVRQASKR